MQCERPIWTGFASESYETDFQLSQLGATYSDGKIRSEQRVTSIVVEMPNQIPNARDIRRGNDCSAR